MKNNSENKHTPGEWYVETFGEHSCAIFKRSKDGSFNRSLVTLSHFDREQQVMNENNAEHICKCVNAHDELVATLRQALQYLHEETTVISHIHFLKHANEVIAKAECITSPQNATS